MFSQPSHKEVRIFLTRKGGESMQQDKLKFRNELKFTINRVDYYTLISRLRAVTKPDANVDVNGSYKIRSLYFDNIHDKALREKIDGVNNREKFRIRYYNDDFSYIKLEKKSKLNGLCNKQATSITKIQCEYLLDGEIEWMKYTQNPLMLELYTKMHYQQLKPKTLVDYKREPFIYKPGNVRITIDQDIRTGLYANDLFNLETPMIHTDTQDTIILEVKYDDFIPEIITDIVQLESRRSGAFSKYAVCRMYG